MLVKHQQKGVFLGNIPSSLLNPLSVVLSSCDNTVSFSLQNTGLGKYQSNLDVNPFELFWTS